ncbi:hypothetical protein GWI33_011850 [Rhynchophorus ferrugineus]|uniref:Uncharacterized protein n=1 Tax=Rhynchophorus ferrugineus TaxID=354439 RepID=A0A834MEJ5_RHYFE|nr:hypothetical protein GWI33_011850 [Rhynchophorus ferrugineus]
MTGRCDSSPAQYERNCRFRYLVHARAGYVAKLPSVGLCLNASNAVSFLGDRRFRPRSSHENSQSPVGSELIDERSIMGR